MDGEAWLKNRDGIDYTSSQAKCRAGKFKAESESSLRWAIDWKKDWIKSLIEKTLKFP